MSSDRDSSVVGRDGELEAVERFLAADRGALVLEGEPGIGKSTVWARGVERVAGRRVLLARPAEVETALPFSALSVCSRRRSPRRCGRCRGRSR